MIDMKNDWMKVEDIADVYSLLGGSKLYSTQHAVEQSGATRRQLNHWASKGWLNPHNRNAGTGNALEWTAKEIKAATYIRRLIEAGMNVERAQRVARLIIDNPDPSKSKRSIRLGNGVWILLEVDPSAASSRDTA